MSHRSSAWLFASLGLVCLACVNLEKPQPVAACSVNDTCTDFPRGGSVPVGSGGAGGSGGTAGTVANGGAAGGAPGTGGGGATGTGGVVASGGVVADALPDVPFPTGGAGGEGGTTGAGGISRVDAADVPGSSGGVITSGGTTSGGAGGSGGKTGAGGVSSGGTTATGGAVTYNCANAVEPASGLITDFSGWNATSSTWTTGSLSGNVYAYASTGASATVKVEGAPPGAHLTGSVPSGYAGGGLTFYSCVKTSAFTKIAFDVYGSAPNCSISLQLQTFDQRPTDQTPPGGCKVGGGTNCWVFPSKSQVVNLGTAVAAPGTTVTTTLSGMTNWTSAAASQIVGLQWQFNSSGGTCTMNATFANVRFMP